MGNYLNARVGNYAVLNPPQVRNFVVAHSIGLADHFRMSSVWRLMVEGGIGHGLRGVGRSCSWRPVGAHSPLLAARPPRRCRRLSVDDRVALTGIVYVLRQGVSWCVPGLTIALPAAREGQHTVIQGIVTPYNAEVNEGRTKDVKLAKRLMGGRVSVPLLQPLSRPDRPSTSLR